MIARILVCDDSVFMRTMLKNVLVDFGHEIIGEAGNGIQAVQLYRKLAPDIVTMDITMPQMDGIEAVRTIRNYDPLAVIIMVTAIGQKAVMIDAIDAGAVDFIVKPFEQNKINKTVERALMIRFHESK